MPRDPRPLHPPLPLKMVLIAFWIVGSSTSWGEWTSVEHLLQAVCKDAPIRIVNVHESPGKSRQIQHSWIGCPLFVQRSRSSRRYSTGGKRDNVNGHWHHSQLDIAVFPRFLDHVFCYLKENPEQELSVKKGIAMDLLSAWHTLIILDNMETIYQMKVPGIQVRNLPPGSKARVLLTASHTKRRLGVNDTILDNIEKTIEFIIKLEDQQSFRWTCHLTPQQ